MIDKRVASYAEAVAGIIDGATVMIGGFGAVGQPDLLINALVEAWTADRWGNLGYRGSGRNFNPIMAMAATLTIAQGHNIEATAGLDPEPVDTPGIYVQRVLKRAG